MLFLIILFFGGLLLCLLVLMRLDLVFHLFTTKDETDDSNPPEADSSPFDENKPNDG